ncbi:hypothetical protein PTKIN_Ptkin13bG0279000 [Pterospermum kingtungense]
MSQRPNRHQRKPSQSVFASLEDLSLPVDNARDNYKHAPSSNVQAPPSQTIFASAPPAAASAPAKTSDHVAKDGEEPKNATS